jgi:hypothetical protein
MSSDPCAPSARVPGAAGRPRLTRCRPGAASNSGLGRLGRRSAVGTATQEPSALPAEWSFSSRSGPRRSFKPQMPMVRRTKGGAERTVKEPACRRANSRAWEMVRSVLALTNRTSPRSSTRAVRPRAMARAKVRRKASSFEMSCSPASQTTLRCGSGGAPGTGARLEAASTKNRWGPWRSPTSGAATAALPGSGVRPQPEHAGPARRGVLIVLARCYTPLDVPGARPRRCRSNGLTAERWSARPRSPARDEPGARLRRRGRPRGW